MLELPLDRPRPAGSVVAGCAGGVRVDAAVHGRLSALARAHRASVVHDGACGVGGAVGAVVGGRRRGGGQPGGRTRGIGLDDLVGMFVNTVVLRTRVERGWGSARCSICAGRGSRRVRACGGPVRASGRRVCAVPSTAHTPLFQVVVEMADTETFAPSWPGLVAEPVLVDPGVAKFDLQVSVAERFDPTGHRPGWRWVHLRDRRVRRGVRRRVRRRGSRGSWRR